jgi:hypothetical protein
MPLYIDEAVGCAVAVQRVNAERNAEFPEDLRIIYRTGICQTQKICRRIFVAS